MASNDLSITISAKDQASRTLAQVSDNVNKLSTSSVKAASGMDAAAGSSARGWTVLAGSIAAVGLSIGGLTNFIGASVKSANDLQSSLLGLSSVASAFGANATQAKTAAQQLASDGLMTVSDAATGLKNLLAAGFNLDQAVTLMNRFKDSAAFSRQAALGFGESIRGATEGIKNGNSMLVDNAGVTKNLSVILEEAGYSAQDLMKASSDAGVRQAIFNGIIRETAAQTGDAAELTGTYAGAQARAAAQTEQFKQQVGGVVQLMTGGLMQGLTSILSGNQQAIISFGAASVAAGALGAAMFVVVRGIQAFSMASVIAAATNPLILALTALAVLAGVVVYKAVDKMQAKVGESNKNLGTMGDTLGKKVPAQSGQASKALGDLAEKLGDIDKQIAKANRDFQENLAEMVKSHQGKVSSLQSQLADENASYDQAAARQSEDYKQAQADIEDQRSQATKDLQKSLNMELALGKWANQTRVTALQQQIDKENAKYDQQLADKKLNYDRDVADAQQAHNQKTNDLQMQLDQENALLTKHAADVASIRNVTLLDEIDKLKRTHDEQIAAFEDQKKKAIESSGQAAAGVVDNWNSAAAQLSGSPAFAGAGTQMGKAMGDAFKQALVDTFVDTGKKVGAFIGLLGQMFSGIALYDIIKNKGNISKTINDEWTRAANAIGGSKLTKGFAAGGFTGRGAENDVAGVVHRGEYVIPKSGVDQQTGLPKSDAMGGGNTFHIYNQVDLTAAMREQGWRLAHA